jgi:pimeloyl-ACP methyl ester carboxylesterase
MPYYENGDARIYYEEAGSGFPLLILPGAGLNGLHDYGATNASFDPMVEFKDEYRCISIDRRNAKGGKSTGPLDLENPWDMYTNDHIGLMDHLGIDRFMVMGFCVGGPMIWNTIRLAGDRVAAGVLVHPSGFRPEVPDYFYWSNLKNWAPALCEARDDVTMETAEKFLAKMYDNADFVITVDRDFTRRCETPLMVLLDDTIGHPYAVAMESALLAPNAQVGMYPWQDVPARVPLAVRHIRTFLKANRPAAAATALAAE